MHLKLYLFGCENSLALPSWNLEIPETSDDILPGFPTTATEKHANRIVILISIFPTSLVYGEMKFSEVM